MFDLMTGEDRRVDKGINPRWANNHNWLFYCHRTGDGTPPYATGTQVIRYDAGSGEKVVITHGMEGPGSLDSTDTWLYGVQRYRGQKPEMVTVRVHNRPGSTIERIAGAPNMHGYVHVNPRHPVIMVRAKDSADAVYGRNRSSWSSVRLVILRSRPMLKSSLKGNSTSILTVSRPKGHLVNFRGTTGPWPAKSRW